MLEPKAPCLDCKKRKLYCHDHCEIFREYKELHDEWHRIVLEARLKDGLMKDIQKKRFEKYNKAVQKLGKRI